MSCILVPFFDAFFWAFLVPLKKGQKRQKDTIGYYRFGFFIYAQVYKYIGEILGVGVPVGVCGGGKRLRGKEM